MESGWELWGTWGFRQWAFPSPSSPSTVHVLASHPTCACLSALMQVRNAPLTACLRWLEFEFQLLNNARPWFSLCIWSLKSWHHKHETVRGMCTGTDNEELLQSQFYVGSKHKRVRGEVYYELLDEFISAAKRRYCAWHLIKF